MGYFDRFDICLAYEALEADWNVGGWLRERPSNQRRNESIAVQLGRMGFRAGMSAGGSFEALDDNAREIYIGALERFGLGEAVPYDDSIAEYLRANYVPEYLRKHFPKV